MFHGKGAQASSEAQGPSGGQGTQGGLWEKGREGRGCTGEQVAGAAYEGVMAGVLTVVILIGTCCPCPSLT